MVPGDLRRLRVVRPGECAPGVTPITARWWASGTIYGMRVDHVVYAAEAEGLLPTAKRLGEALGVEPGDSGVHPRFGTRNVILPLANNRFIEVVEVLDHPASDKAPFGQAVRARSEQGGGWMGWVVAMDDLYDGWAGLDGVGAVLSFDIKGGRKEAWAFIDALKLHSNVANIGDSRSLVVHPATTTHAQCDERGQEVAGITEATIRLSIGLESPEDIIDDLKLGFAALSQA